MPAATTRRARVSAGCRRFAIKIAEKCFHHSRRHVVISSPRLGWTPLSTPRSPRAEAATDPCVAHNLVHKNTKVPTTSSNQTITLGDHRKPTWIVASSAIVASHVQLTRRARGRFQTLILSLSLGEPISEYGAGIEHGIGY
jgi:hypothetical protein